MKKFNITSKTLKTKKTAMNLHLQVVTSISQKLRVTLGLEWSECNKVQELLMKSMMVVNAERRGTEYPDINQQYPKRRMTNFPAYVVQHIYLYTW